MSQGWFGGRREPTFETRGKAGSRVDDLRADPHDRAGGPFRRGSNARRDEMDDDEPPARPRSRRSKPVRQRRSWFGFLAYWSLVLGVWSIVGVVGLTAYYAAQLPPIDQLAVPRRPPNIAILADDGSLLANRGDTGGAAVRLSDLPPLSLIHI